jgi:hypothetical protein
MLWTTVEEQAQAAEPDQQLRNLLPEKFADRPLQSGLVFVPQDIRLDGEALIWKAAGARYKHTRSGMLDDFISLCDAEDHRPAVLAYARRWGVLGSCRHNLPCTHNQPPFCGTQVDQVPGSVPGSVPRVAAPMVPCLPMLVTPLPAEGSDFWFWEPVDAWCEWSRKAKALLVIAAQLSRGKTARHEDWNLLKGNRDSGLGESSAEPYVQDLRAARRELAWELDGWISIGQVRPRVAWNKTPAGWRFSLDAVSIGPNLFGLLALYIATEVAGTEKGIAICSSCSKSYQPERRLNPNNRNYCPKCRGESGKQAARRDAAREFRKRQREKRA